jgi:lysophospholipase L1-like esterase
LTAKSKLKFLLLFLVAGVATSCSKHGNIRVVAVSQLGVGQSVTLSAYEEQRPSHLLRSATPDEPITRNPVEPVWSVSDPEIATVDQSGVLHGQKPGQVAVKAVWETSEYSQNVQVLPELRAKVLPQLTVDGQLSMPKDLHLTLGKDRSLQLKASFDSASDDLTVNVTAPDSKLPWSFPFGKGTLEITDAKGHAILGTVKVNNGGALKFAVWSEGDGTYPISLQGKTVLVVGDSMSDGLAWFMKGKVEDAGGKFIGNAWNSSSTIGWADSHKMREFIEQYQPDIVFIALGSNEVEVPKVESRGAAVKQISDEMGDRPGYWIGPPSWVPDKGIVQVIESNFRPGHFYNANDLKVPRRGDGKHPNRDGFKIWVDLIWDWYAKTE